METKYTSKIKDSSAAKNKVPYIPKPDKNRDISSTIVPECNPNNGAFFEELSNPLSSKGN